MLQALDVCCDVGAPGEAALVDAGSIDVESVVWDVGVKLLSGSWTASFWVLSLSQSLCLL